MKALCLDFSQSFVSLMYNSVIMYLVLSLLGIVLDLIDIT